MTRLSRWRPFPEIDELFKPLLGRMPAIPAELSKEMEWSPATDVSETPTEYLVKADYKDGVLNVHLPKMSVETPKPVKIAVQ